MKAILALVLVLGYVLAPMPASAAVDPDCLKDPYVGNTPMGNPVVPMLKTKNEPVDIGIIGALLADCPNTSVTARTPGGGLITVPLNVNLPQGILPERLGGHLNLPLGYGAGLWQLTKITSGGTTKTLHHPFDVYRGAEVTLNNPATVAAPNPVTFSGTVKRYTSTGALVPSPNTAVAISVLKNLTTNSAGAFSGTAALPPGETAFRATSVLGAASPIRIATVTEPLPPVQTELNAILFKSVAYVNEWWRVDAVTTPGTRYNELQKPTEDGWKSTGSYAYSTSAGKLTRWWKPVAPGTYPLRLRAGGSSTVYHLLSRPIVVTSKQTIPTYVDAKVKPTNGGTVYGGTPMTLDGHLKVRYSNGTIGPYAGQSIRIQARETGTSTWTTTIATLKTSSSGYFITHWAMRYQSNIDIRFLFLSPYVTIKNSQIIKSNIQVTP